VVDKSLSRLITSYHHVATDQLSDQLSNGLTKIESKEFIETDYHAARPHQGLNGDTPIPQEKPSAINGPSKLISIPVLGGLHHRYQRVAA
jgi:hypothetical protein